MKIFWTGKMLSVYSCLCLLLLGLDVFAQKIEVGLGVGGINYKGDLAPNFQPLNIRYAGEAFFKYNLYSFLNFKAGVMLGEIGARDAQSRDPFLKQRDLFFSGRMREVSVRAEYNFFNFRPKNNRRKFEKWCPFLFVGVAGSNYEVKNNYTDNSSFRKSEVVIPFGLGVKHFLHPSWNLSLEFGARKMFSDTLDGIIYDINVPKLRQTNPENTDMYFYTGISISYLFQGIRCPVTL
jgi:hypothetical protein